MKKLYLFVIAFAFSSMLNAQWVSPGNGTTYTIEDLVVLSNGCVIWSESNNSYRIENDVTISANDKFVVNHSLNFGRGHKYGYLLLVVFFRQLWCEWSYPFGGCHSSVRVQKMLYYTIGRHPSYWKRGCFYGLPFSELPLRTTKCCCRLHELWPRVHELQFW